MITIEDKVVRYIDTVMRASEDNTVMRVEGYALKFDKETVIGSKKWGWKEKIDRTALDNANLSNVVFDFNHSFDSLLARTTNNSLKLIRDSTGLKVSADIIDTAIGRDVYKMIQEGLVTRMSFMAIVTKSQWIFAEGDSEDLDERTIMEFSDFYDVSAVTFPAYEDTSLQTRSPGDSDTVAYLKAEHDKLRRELQDVRLDNIMKSLKGGH